MDLYLKFSSMLREIYGEYTNLVEPYGCDEAWLDVTDSTVLKGGGRKIAEEISRRVKRELGITVSIGISWNKIFAKLGSDYKKPDGITAFMKGAAADGGIGQRCRQRAGHNIPLLYLVIILYCTMPGRQKICGIVQYSL